MDRLFIILVIGLMIFSIGISGCSTINAPKSLNNVNATEGTETVKITNLQLPIDSEEKACNIAKQVTKTDINCTAENNGDNWTAAYSCGVDQFGIACGGSLDIDSKTGDILDQKVLA
jgi:uncharacterized protein YceK